MAKYEDFLNELVILEKKYLLYSHGHDFVNLAVLDLLRTMGELHEITPKIKIVDTGNGLVVNDVEFHGGNVKAGYLMQLLGGRGILSVTFSAGVGFSSILDFFYLLNAIPTNSKLLYHSDIQFAIHNIDSIEIEEVDYGSLRYGYGAEAKDQTAEDNPMRAQLQESLKTFDPDIGSYNTDELIDIALDELSKMPQNKVPDFLQGLSNDAVSEIIARVNAKGNSISPSLIDLLLAVESARKLAGDDNLERVHEEISYDQVNKLVEREAYELYVSDDYRQHLRSLLAYDIQSVDSIAEIDMFDRSLIDRTILTALIHLTRNKLDNRMQVSFVDSIHKYLDEFIDCKDWQFIQSISDNEVVASYLKEDSTVERLSETIRGSKSYSNNHLMEVLQTSGTKNLSWLMDSYIDEGDSRIRRGILILIQSFQEIGAIHAVIRFLGDPAKDLSIFMPIIKGHLGSVPRDLSSKLFALDSADAKLLAMRILLTQEDKGVKNHMEGFILTGENEFVLGLLDLVREFRITELTGTLIKRIRTFYIDETMFKLTIKTIDTISWIDSKAYGDLEKRLMKTVITLSPKKLRRIKKYLKGVSHDYKSR